LFFICGGSLELLSSLWALRGGNDGVVLDDLSGIVGVLGEHRRCSGPFVLAVSPVSPLSFVGSPCAPARQGR